MELQLARIALIWRSCVLHTASARRAANEQFTDQDGLKSAPFLRGVPQCRC